MNKLSLLTLMMLPAVALADAPLPMHSHDFHPNQNFVELRGAYDTAAAGVYQLGEVAILEGDYGMVSFGTTGFAIRTTATIQNHYSITKRFLTKYADDFDEVIIFTTFEDNGAPGALAYEISIFQDIQNIGDDILDDTALWGSGTKRMHAFVNMMRWSQFESDGMATTDPNNFFYPVLGQEFAHRWLSFVKYKDALGRSSAAMLGRDAAHWASTLETNGSVLDGNTIVPQTDGTFLVTEYMQRYSDLDLYIMGLIPANKVKPFFRVDGAKLMDGTPVDATQPVSVGAKMTGTRENIIIDQVVAALGARFPDYAAAPKSFRTAFVVLTAPGEKASAGIEAARLLDKVRKVWEQKFKEYTGGAGTMCTNLLTPCGSPVANIVDGEITEAGGNGNGVVEPGEPIKVKFTLANSGTSAASGISVAAAGTAVAGVAAQSIASLEPDASDSVTFSGTVPKDAKCGETVTVTAEATMGGTAWPGLASVVPGKRQALMSTFEDNEDGFTVEPGSTTNGWAYGTPEGYKHTTGFVYQPTGGHSASSKAWFTGLQAGHRAQFDSSLGVGGSVLYSPNYDMTKILKPTVRYWVWYQGIDYTDPMLPQNTVGAKLTIDTSLDGGKTWMAFDKADSTVSTWDEHRISLDTPQYKNMKTLQLRFTIINPQPTYQVEAGIDDFELIGLTAACDTSSGGCTMSERAAPVGGAALVAFVSLLLVTFARRRARCTLR
ncbi:MAG: hypothetical protein JWN44_7087 [Myxococcales bacterium]|nr:hypothetical protein [Myxococcales bacterium]